ncbi:MAG: hypothetical protein R8G66_02925 [Cytophagales bacterium]|nr:hypothetical protein [Cytophagales bacterium]
MTDTAVEDVHQKALEKEKHLYNHGIRGELPDVGGPVRYNDQSETHPTSEKAKHKQRLKDEFMRVVNDLVNEAYNRLIERFDKELTELSIQIQELETKMQANRDQWDLNIERLNDIDNVLLGFEDGGKLDRPEAHRIMEDHFETGISENSSDAELLLLLEQVRKETLEGNEVLDRQFAGLENIHSQKRQREQRVLNAKTELEVINNNSELNNDQKVAAIHQLGRETGTKTLHASATETQDQEAKKLADDSIYSTKVEQHVETKVNVSGFPGLN